MFRIFVVQRTVPDLLKRPRATLTTFCQRRILLILLCRESLLPPYGIRNREQCRLYVFLKRNEWVDNGAFRIRLTAFGRHFPILYESSKGRKPRAGPNHNNRRYGSHRKPEIRFSDVNGNTWRTIFYDGR